MVGICIVINKFNKKVFLWWNFLYINSYIYMKKWNKKDVLFIMLVIKLFIYLEDVYVLCFILWLCYLILSKKIVDNFLKYKVLVGRILIINDVNVYF